MQNDCALNFLRFFLDHPVGLHDKIHNYIYIRIILYNRTRSTTAQA